MPEIRIGSLTAAPVARPLWDSVWLGGLTAPDGGADWAVAQPDEAGNEAGLQARYPLETAIVICLFTDRRLPDEMAETGQWDRRGWHGDTFDLDAEAGERAMGSLLWTLDRSALAGGATGVARRAEDYAAEALQTLIDQGLIARFDIEAEVDAAAGRLSLRVAAYDGDGTPTYAGTLPVL